jgi:hypothetical protein
VIATQRQNGGRKPNGKHAHPSTNGRLDQLGGPALHQKLKEARENLAYWRMAKAAAPLHCDRIDAAARVLAWTAEVEACERRAVELSKAAHRRR